MLIDNLHEKKLPLQEKYGRQHDFFCIISCISARLFVTLRPNLHTYTLCDCMNILVAEYHSY